MANTEMVRLPKPVYEAALKLKREREFQTLGEAVRHVFQEAGYEV